MRNSDKIKAIIAQKCEGVKNEFAKRVGIGTTTLSSWLSRETIDFEKIAKAFPDISADWLIRDKGPMIIDEVNANIKPQMEMMDLIVDQAKQIRELRHEIENYKKSNAQLEYMDQAAEG